MKLTTRHLLILSLTGGIFALAMAHSHLRAIGSPSVWLPEAATESRPITARRPVDLLLSPDARTLIVANQNGLVSLVDAQVGGQLIDEISVGETLSGLTRLGETDVYFISDDSRHEVIACRFNPQPQPGLAVLWRRATVPYPTKLAINASQSRLCICGLWSRQIALWHVGTAGWENAAIETRDLEFCPGHAVWISERRLFVADAFGDSIAVIDTESKQMIYGRVPGNRFGGLALSPDGQYLLLTGQRLNPLARSTRNDVHWGLMIANQLRSLACEDLVRVSTKSELDQILTAARRQPVGGPENAKADLGPLAVASDSIAAITIGGVNELAIGQWDDDSFAFVPVGKRPLAIAVRESDEMAFVANHLDDSVSQVSLSDFDLVHTFSLGKRPDPDLRSRGEQLFYDARLSHDGWMSCHSCHVEGHTNGFLNDNFSDQSFHTAKLVISLLGHGDSLPLTWSGQHADFATQMRRSVESTMQGGRPLSDTEVSELTAFVRSLPPPPAVSVARGDLDEQQRRRGQQLFESLDCTRCHVPPMYTTAEVFDVGVTDEHGTTKFNPPSLVGLGQRDRYFHDGRYGDLTRLLIPGEHEVPRELTDRELSDLMVFLKSL